VNGSASWFDRYVAGTGFLQRYPFYAAVLAQFDCENSTRVPVMAVRWRDGRFVLLVNEPFFDREPRFGAGVLLHEVHHVVLGHLVHPRFAGVERADLMRLAMEVSANEYIAEPLPDPIVWQQFREFGLGPHQGTLRRHELLLAAGDRLDREHRLDGLFCDHGGDVDAGGDAGTGIDELVRGAAAPSGAVPTLRLLLERAQAIADDFPPPPPAPTPGVRGLIEQLSRQSGPGRLLGRDLDAVLAALTPPPGGPSVDWRHELARFARRGPDTVWHRPNRRQPQRVFELPGRSWRGGDVELLVAIDTSGSMSDDELAAVARELRALAGCCRLTIAECDDKIRRVYRFAGRLGEVLGRGGTDLRPPFAPELLKRHGRDGVVYFTDGDGPWPRQPPRVPVLWVLTTAGRFPCPWGRKTHLRVDAPLDEDGVPF
jgi:predicted metal-dependent peptidase